MKHSLLNRARKRFLQTTAKSLDAEGDFVELGSWRGGSAATFIKGLPDASRDCWLFDSFEGMPAPTAVDRTANKHAEEYRHLGMPDDDANTYTICTDLMRSLEYPDEKIHIIKGWYENTFPKHADDIQQISVLHVDCDWYSSVKYSLEVFYDKVVPNGVVVIDDYGHWQGCKKAVDEFLEERGISAGLTSIDYTGVWMRKDSD